jgi:hypothetical protein
MKYNMYNFNKAKFSKMQSITGLTVSDSELDIICPELVHIATDFNPIWVRAHSERGRLAHVTSWLCIT